MEKGKTDAAAWVASRHDGYRHLPGAPMHRRRVTVEAERMKITDWVDGDGKHSAKGFLPLHPGVRAARSDRHWLLTTPEGHRLKIDIDGPVHAEVQPGRFAHGFGLAVERPVIEWTWSGSLPLRVETQITLMPR
jgi:hypothetical protein